MVSDIFPGYAADYFLPSDDGVDVCKPVYGKKENRSMPVPDSRESFFPVCIICIVVQRLDCHMGAGAADGRYSVPAVKS